MADISGCTNECRQQATQIVALEAELAATREQRDEFRAALDRARKANVAVCSDCGAITPRKWCESCGSTKRRPPGSRIVAIIEAMPWELARESEGEWINRDDLLDRIREAGEDR